MKHWHEELPFDFTHPQIQQTFTEQSLFFDIETTGFSAARTSLYLIGCAARKGDTLLVDQFFAENPKQEQEVLAAFCAYMESLKQENGFDTVITFNGIGFDIPYLREKFKKYQMPDPFCELTFLDIFKQVSQLKSLLALPDLKQKTVESFLGLGRDDCMNGGELIEVYHAYTASPEPELLALLKLHNYEDVIDMPKLLTMLSYHRLLEGEFSVSAISANEYTSYDGTPGKELLLTLLPQTPVPKRISCHYEDFHLVIDTDKTTLCIHLTQQELKHFFSDYKNYVYLPEEDCAIHKDSAASIDKSKKKKATASTCYTRKYAIFVPQYSELVKPAFRVMYRDKKSYFALSEEFVSSKELQKDYVLHILEFIRTKKK